MNDNLPIAPLAPLPVDVRPRLGETTVNYVQRLARANHLKSSELIRILAPPPHTIGSKPVLARVAKASGRPQQVLARTLSDAAPAHRPIWTRADIRLRHHTSLNDLGTDQLDDHDTWLTLTTVTRLYLDFSTTPRSRSHQTK